MIEGMGGVDSQHYREFKRKTCEAFNVLRKHRHYLISLVMLMVDANIKDLSNNWLQTLQEINQRFMPEYSDEEAAKRFDRIIDDSVNSLFAEVMEVGHRIAVALKY